MVLSEKLEKTTKSKFINDITKNKSLFLGKSYSNINIDQMNIVINNNYKLTFSDNSKFYINRSSQTVYVYNHNNCKVYVIHELHDNYNDRFRNIFMFYFIAN